MRLWIPVALGLAIAAYMLFEIAGTLFQSAPRPVSPPSQVAASAPVSAPAAPVAPRSAPAQSSANTPPAPAQQPPTSGVAGDAAAGRTVFRKCSVCHSLEPDKNLVGPSLAGIIGRKAGAESGFAFSDAMKNSGITWDRAHLDAYLADPQAVVPGNRMPFPGLKSQHDRDDVIAFLASAAAPVASAGIDQARSAALQSPSGQAGRAAAPERGDMPDVRYTLRSGIAEGRMVYIGVGGGIDGKVNPALSAAQGQGVQITLINGEGAEHDITLPEQNVRSPHVTGRGASTTIAFRAGKPGDYVYFCSLPGHRAAGMEGHFTVTEEPPPAGVAQADISRVPTDVPPPIGKRGPETVRVDLETAEIEGRLADDTTFGYWTFNGTVPGPMLRVRVGDTIEVHLKNSADSLMIHSVDLHAALGPGGGAASLQVDPGDEKSMSFKAMVPGLYVYHCATPMVAEHIANGMYGMILVEPEGGLPPVDHEFYVMQGEIYTEGAFGHHGSQEFSVEKLLSERPEYFVLNGSVGALTKLHPMHAKVGETVRIYFGVGGPNFTSSFHIIGEIFDNVYTDGSLISPPVHGVQTVTVPAGGSTIVEFTPQVPGSYALVDHALARMERGLAGVLLVEGAANPAIYSGDVMPGMGH